MVREQMSDREETLLVEPIPRNTAAAVALAVAQADADTLLLVMPSDQVIADVPAFHAAIAQGVRPAQQAWTVNFGIPPDRPEPGFGYIANGTGPWRERVCQYVEESEDDVYIKKK